MIPYFTPLKVKIMRATILNTILVTLFVIVGNSAFAQDADKIIGTYLTEENKGKVVITKKDNKYYGTLVWTNAPDALDEKNPDKNKRKNKIAGTIILKDLVYTGNGTWENGTVYDPESGKIYSGKITLNKNGNLNMRGYVGISAFGRTTVWTRVK